MDRLRFNNKLRKSGIIIFMIGLAGCSLSEIMEPFQSEPTPQQPSSSYAVDSKPTPYYTGANGLKLYAEPNSASKVLARLGLYQKVLRYKQEKGYAYVTVVGSGIEGWIDNGKLIWQLPVPAKPKPTRIQPAPSAKPSTQKEQPGPVEPEPPQTAPKTRPEPVSTVVPPQSEVPAAEPSAEQPPGTLAPSIFNPF